MKDALEEARADDWTVTRVAFDRHASPHASISPPLFIGHDLPVFQLPFPRLVPTMLAHRSTSIAEPAHEEAVNVRRIVLCRSPTTASRNANTLRVHLAMHIHGEESLLPMAEETRLRPDHPDERGDHEECEYAERNDPKTKRENRDHLGPHRVV